MKKQTKFYINDIINQKYLRVIADTKNERVLGIKIEKCSEDDLLVYDKGIIDLDGPESWQLYEILKQVFENK